MMKYKAVKSDDPYDPDRPYYIEGSDYEEFNQLEAATITAILNENGENLEWDAITQDYRWLMVEGIQAHSFEGAADRLRDDAMASMGHSADPPVEKLAAAPDATESPLMTAAPLMLAVLTEGIGIPANSDFAADLDTIADQLDSRLPVYAEKIRAKAQAIRAAIAAARGETQGV